MGLRDQLLKAGLVSKKQAQQAEAQARRLAHAAKVGSQEAKEADAARAEEQRRLEAEAAAKREADKERNRELESARRDREKIFRARQLVRSNRLNEPRAQEPYYFLETVSPPVPEDTPSGPAPHATYVRRVDVNAYQREMLARGKFAIVRLDVDVDEFTLVPLHTAATLEALVPGMVLVKHPPLDDAAELNVE